MSGDYWDDPGVKAAEEAYEKARKEAEEAKRQAEEDERKREFSIAAFKKARQARLNVIAAERDWYYRHPDRIPHKRHPFGVQT